MTRNRYDVAIVGLGAMGSAALWSLARKGHRVVGIDRHSPPHSMGSTHGESRIIREAYFEDPRYVPLVRAAYERWEELERLSGRTLLLRTGGLMVGPSDGALLTGTRRSVREHAIPHEELDAAAIRCRFPGLTPEEGMCGLFEARGGILFPERCVEAFLDGAIDHGADLRLGVTVEGWSADESGALLATSGETQAGDDGLIRADRLILAGGPWMPELLPGLELPLQVERQFFRHFAPLSDTSDFEPSRCPIVLWEHSAGELFYTFPDLGEGVKAGIHHEGVSARPDTIDRKIHPGEDRAIRALMDRFLPRASGDLLGGQVCMYTNTPDEHFVIDLHPAHPNVVVASVCSGHGFKFASVIGEVLGDLATTGTSDFDLEAFRIDRAALR